MIMRKSYQQFAIVTGDTAQQLTDRLNEKLIELNEKKPTVSIEGMIARISYTEEVDRPESAVMFSRARVRTTTGGLLILMGLIWLMGVAGADDADLIQNAPEPVSLILIKVAAGLAGLAIGLIILRGGGRSE